MLRKANLIHLAIVALIAVLNSVANAEGPATRPQFTLSSETTGFEGPLKTDGSVDYVAAINARMKAGISPENNACALLCQACQPLPEMNTAFFHELGVVPTDDEATLLDYFEIASADDEINFRVREDSLKAGLIRQPGKNFVFGG